MRRYAFGVDLGGTTVKVGLFETNGTLLDMWEILSRTEESGKYILPDIAAAVMKKLKDRDIAKAEVEGIGIGIPGPVCKDGTVLRCVNLGWGIFNVESSLYDLTGMRVRAANDANVAALGEMWQGGGKGFQDLVMVTLGTGVGGGIIVNGHIFTGAKGSAGEIGHIPMVDDEMDICGCGKRGCLEQYASATGMVRITRRYLKEHPDADTSLTGSCAAKDIFDAAKAGDETALHMVAEMTDILGKACASVACVINPEVFVIGGGISNAGKILMDPLENAFRRYAFHTMTDTVFKRATLGNKAGIYGGVKLVLED